jgi:hypothetical protein
MPTGSADVTDVARLLVGTGRVVPGLAAAVDELLRPAYETIVSLPT